MDLCHFDFGLIFNQTNENVNSLRLGHLNWRFCLFFYLLQIFWSWSLAFYSEATETTTTTTVILPNNGGIRRRLARGYAIGDRLVFAVYPLSLLQYLFVWLFRNCANKSIWLLPPLLTENIPNTFYVLI